MVEDDLRPRNVANVGRDDRVETLEEAHFDQLELHLASHGMAIGGQRAVRKPYTSTKMAVESGGALCGEKRSLKLILVVSLSSS